MKQTNVNDYVDIIWEKYPELSKEEIKTLSALPAGTAPRKQKRSYRQGNFCQARQSGYAKKV